MFENEPGDTGDIEFNLGASMDAIAAEMGGDDETNDGGTEADISLADDTKKIASQTKQQASQVTTTGTVTDQTLEQPRLAPKSWAKDQHERWSKIDRDTQSYIELREKQMLDGLDMYKTDAQYARQLKEAIGPYSSLLREQGVNETEAVQYLLNAHQMLTTGSPEQRMEVYRKLGADLGLQAPNGQEDPNSLLVDLQKKTQRLESHFEAQQRDAFTQKRQKADLETNTFASDPANIYFDDVAPDMVPLVKAGFSLKDAYDTCVLKNPVTRQKEVTRLQTEADAARQAKTKTDAEAAKLAIRTNVRGARTQTAPTEPKGSIEDTMHETLKSIRART